jgi:hypothetical protein
VTQSYPSNKRAIGFATDFVVFELVGAVVDHQDVAIPLSVETVKRQSNGARDFCLDYEAAVSVSAVRMLPS